MTLGRSLTLKDATVLSIAIKERWSGEKVQEVLEKLFKQNGIPTQIVIDGASNLKKGVREVLSGINRSSHVTYDITHLMANLIKKKYSGNMKFLSAMRKLATTSKNIAQTRIGYLQPPKLREKSRFLNMPKLAVWFYKTMDVLKSESLKRDEKKQIKKYFGWLWEPKWEAYLKKFTKEVIVLKNTQKILKNTGISEFSYKKACASLSGIDDRRFTDSIIDALHVELVQSNQTGFPALLTSDLIESLFGKYKSIALPHKLSEINKTILSIPCICEEITPKLIDKAFSKTKNRQVDWWVKRNIPPTLLSRRRKVLGSIDEKPNVTKLDTRQSKSIFAPHNRQISAG